MRWKIYYPADTYSDEDGGPELAPGIGCQVIRQLDKDHGTRTIKGGNQGLRDDFFWWDLKTQSWFNGDREGLQNYLIRPGWKKVLYGESIGNGAFDELYKRAMVDPGFPEQTGWRRHER